jgi:hypothetical protein
LPYLQFARDKRGYETTSLVHAFRGRQGRAQQKVLYWFRTPPGVKVGRPALDQEAIRWIEEHNPDIEFDWPKILEATPPSAPSEEVGGRRLRRGRSERPERGDRPERRGAHQRSPETPHPPARPLREAPPLPSAAASQPAMPPPEEEALEQITHPDAEEKPLATTSAVESVLGREQLIRFRARYAELQARIIERGGEPSRVEELRARSEGLDPDSWVTLAEARKGLETFEPRIGELRAALGLKRRRRSRRGGRRHRASGPALGNPANQTTSPAPSSNSTPGRESDDAVGDEQAQAAESAETKEGEDGEDGGDDAA